MKPVVLYHKGCLDGFASAFIFYKTFGDDMKYIPGVHGHTDISKLKGKTIYMVDFSLPRNQVEELLHSGSEIVLIDHHKQAIDDLRGLVSLENCSVDNSGCVLTWKYLHPSAPVPDLFLYIEDRDLWKFRFPDTKAITKGLYSRKMDFLVWDGVKNDELIRDGQILLREHNATIARINATASRIIEFLGYEVKLVNCPYMFVSDLCEQYPSDPFIMTYYDSSDSRKFSMRTTRDDINLAGLAKLYGGGGHPKSAGFVVPRDHGLAKI